MKIIILDGNYNSEEEAKQFAEFVRARGYEVDYRENTSGVASQNYDESVLKNNLWNEFCSQPTAREEWK